MSNCGLEILALLCFLFFVCVYVCVLCVCIVRVCVYCVIFDVILACVFLC